MDTDSPYYKPVPLSKNRADQNTPFYDVTHLADAENTLRNRDVCFVCGTTFPRHLTFESYAWLCFPQKPLQFEPYDSMDGFHRIKRFYRWITRFKKPSCPLGGAHKHYRCPDCDSRFVVNIGDLRLKGKTNVNNVPGLS